MLENILKKSVNNSQALQHPSQTIFFAKAKKIDQNKELLRNSLLFKKVTKTIKEFSQ